MKSSLKLDLVSNPNVLKAHPLCALSLALVSESSLVSLGDSTSITSSALVITSEHFLYQVLSKGYSSVHALLPFVQFVHIAPLRPWTLTHIAAHKPQYHEDEQENLLPAPTQDSFVNQIFGGDPQGHVTPEDIPATPLPSPIVEAQVATIPSPASKP